MLFTLVSSVFLSLFGAYAVAAVGLIDDLKNVHAIWRIPLIFGAAFWSLFWLGEIPALDFGIFAVNQSVLIPISSGPRLVNQFVQFHGWY